MIRRLGGLMIAPLEAPVRAPAWPTVVFTRRKISSDLPKAFVNDADPRLIRVIVDKQELTVRGAYYLFAAIRHNLKRGHWRHTAHGLLLRAHDTTDGHTVGSWPPVKFESVQLNRKAPVMIIDHPKELRVLVDERELTTEGAIALTDAVADHMATGQWQRAKNGLWLTA